MSQVVSEVIHVDIDDGLNEREINKIARDTFGYFYLFQNSNIQRYDGERLKDLKLKPGVGSLLKDVDGSRRSSEGGIVASILKSKQSIYLSPAAEQAEILELKNGGLHLSETQEKFPSFISNNQKLIAKEGSFWLMRNGEWTNIGKTKNQGLSCTILTKDKFGNHIAVFGYSRNVASLILVYMANGLIQNYSTLLDSNNKLKDIYVEDVNNKWMLATFNGLYVCKISRPGISNFYVKENVEGSAFGNLVMGITADGPRKVFVDESYGIWEIDKASQVKQLYVSKKNDFQDNEKILWNSINGKYYSTANYTATSTILYELNSKLDEFQSTIIQQRVLDVLPIGKDQLLISGHLSEVEQRETAGRVMIFNTQLNKEELVLTNIPVARCLYKVDSDYWIGTEKGIWIVDSTFQIKKIITKAFEFPFILSLIKYNGKVFAGSYGGGIYVINPTSYQIEKTYNKENYLSDNLAVSFVEDDLGYLWVGTFNGINVIDQSGSIVVKVNVSDGISHREMNSAAISKDLEGELYFGSLNGVIKLNPKEILHWSESQGLRITKGKVLRATKEEIITFQDGPIELKSGFKKITLDVDFPDFHVDRTSTPLNFLNIPSDSEDFTIRKSEKELIITNLNGDSGEIKFKNSNNDFTQKIAFDISINFNKFLLPGIALFLLGGLLIIFFSKQKLKNLEREEKKKTVLNKNIAELELSALQSQMNPHFIFNALGAIQYFIQTEKTDEADNYLGDFAMLMRKILDSSKAKYISLGEEIEMLKLYVKLEQMRFEKMFDFHLQVDDSIELESHLPPMIIQPFIENAINHGLYNLKERNGVLSLVFKSMGDGALECRITDNGIGRKRARALRNKKHKSRGLQIVKDRITTLNAQKDMCIDLNIHDLYQNGEGKGTEVVIRVFYYD